MTRAYCITTKELAGIMRRHEDIPAELRTDAHLICNTPAAIDFNSPGAQGFGVKRAGLAIPGSIMLLISPACCGRNTAALSGNDHYGERFAYLNLDENDIVTGRHLTKIPAAVKAFVLSRPQPPSAVLLCLTCVDALLGTDMERVCRKAEKAVGLPVRPCYMYALTRESIRPPMTAVRETIYGLLQPRKKQPTQANLLGFFTRLDDRSELFSLLHGAGIRHVGELARCQSCEEFQQLAAANFNLVLADEAMPAALALEKRLQIPAIRLQRLYETDKIARQYQALGNILGHAFDDAACRRQAEQAVQKFCRRWQTELHIAIGSRVNANPFELALAFVRCGLQVNEIFALPSPADSFYINRLAELAPATRIYSNLEPTMLNYEEDAAINMAIGADACSYHPQARQLPWNDTVQPFGYAAVTGLFTAMEHALSTKTAPRETPRTDADTSPYDAVPAEKLDLSQPAPDIPAGLSLRLPPFATDTSGAASVFYPLRGMTVIVDAGGCAGNICGFDEPRWQENFSERHPEQPKAPKQVSAVFSAGLRDMDAIMGRDDRLVKKITQAAKQLPVAFAGLVGTPVPAVIATDFRALCRMIETSARIPAIAVRADGTHTYDRGASGAYTALLRRFDKNEPLPAEKSASARENCPPSLGVLGLTPLDFSPKAERNLRQLLKGPKTYAGSVCFFDQLDDFRQAASLKELLVVSPSGLAAARRLQQKYPQTIQTIRTELPAAFVTMMFNKALAKAIAAAPTRILIVHQQILANSLRRLLQKKLPQAEIHAGTFFLQEDGLCQDGDVAFRGERDFCAELHQHPLTIVLGDPLLRRALPKNFAGAFIDLPHFAVSGHY